MTQTLVLCEHCKKSFRPNSIPRHSQGCLGISPSLGRLYEAGRVTEGADGCLIWRGAINSNGYGKLTPAASAQVGEQLASRAAWLLKNGPIPEGLHVCHTCDNPPCINADHLFVGTQADNNADREAKGRGVAPPIMTKPKETFPCPICDSEVTRVVGAKYPSTCSRSCGQTLTGRMRKGVALPLREGNYVDRTCAVCGKVDQVRRSRADRNPTCSSDCGKKYAWRNRPRKPERVRQPRKKAVMPVKTCPRGCGWTGAAPHAGKHAKACLYPRTLERLQELGGLVTEGPHWIWQGNPDKAGTLGNVRVYVLAYEIAFGEVPEGRSVRRSCGIKGCYAPNCLALG